MPSTPVPRRSFKLFTACVLTLAIVEVGCSNQGRGDVTSGGSPAAGAPSLPAASGASAEILAFSAPALGGGTIQGADYAGKDVAIWFWAPW